MEEKEKPDGYVAWHPTRGAFGDGLLLSRTESEAERRVIAHYYCKHIERDLGECQRQFDADGWRIRPVKLVFLDEPKGGG